MFIFERIKYLPINIENYNYEIITMVWENKIFEHHIENRVCVN